MKRSRLPPVLILGLATALLLTACTSSHYRRSADKEVYRIIQKVEKHVFGHTNEFSIDTPYSKRKPTEILPSELIEDRMATNRQVLTLDQALDLAVVKSREYQTEKERLYQAALTLTEAKHPFWPNLTGSSRGDYRRASEGGKMQQKGSIATDFGVKQTLQTGGSLSVALANDLLRYYTGNPRRSAVTTFSAQLTQPLLNGFGRNSAVVEDFTQKERNVIYAVRTYSHYQHQFAIEIARDYFRLLTQKDVVRNRYTNYLGRVQDTKRLEARLKDREMVADVDQARQAELSARNTYINTLTSYSTRLDAFKLKLGLPLSHRLFLDDQALDELRTTGLLPMAVDPIAAYRCAVNRQLPVLNEIDRFEDSKRKVRIAADRLRPGINLFADGSLQSEGPTDYTRFDPGKFQGGVGLQLDLPLDRLSQRNSYRATLISFDAEVRSLTLTLDTVRDSVEKGLRNLEQARQNYEIQRLALTLANRRVRSSQMLLDAGRTEVRNLVEARDAQINAQIAVNEALLAYQETRLQFLLDLGLAQTDSDKFWLKDCQADLTSLQPAPDGESAGAELIKPDDFFAR